MLGESHCIYWEVLKFKYNFVVSDVGSLLASFIINYECTVSVQQAVEAGFQFMKCGSVLTFDLNLNCSKNSGRRKRLEVQSP